jgi:hypothetical protein
MTLVNSEKEDDLEYIFKEEISVYKSLLTLETSKRDSILQSKGRDLESTSKQISHLLTVAGQVEEKRQVAISKFFESKNVKPRGETIVLSEFLECIQEDERLIFEELAKDLREVVSELREKININEKLLEAKQEIFELSMEALKAASVGLQELGSYDAPSKVNRSRMNVMLNTKA